MDYLQYVNETTKNFNLNAISVLNLIINGLPSIRRVTYNTIKVGDVF